MAEKAKKTKMTVLDFQKFKDAGQIFTYVTAYDYTTASIVNDSDINIILCGDSLGMVMLGYPGTTNVTMDQMVHHTRSVVVGAPDTFVVGDMPFGSYNSSIEQAIINATRLTKETNCDCIKLEGGVDYADTVAAIVKAGINVMGHIGLTPQTSSQLGGFKVQGGTPEGAMKLIEDAKALEAAGAFSLILECVPVNVGKAIQDAVKIPVIGIGAGPHVAAQCLVTHDLLGMYGDFKPKFVKQFAQIREQMVGGLNQFHKEALSGEFPSKEYCFNKEVVLDKLY